MISVQSHTATREVSIQLDTDALGGVLTELAGEVRARSHVADLLDDLAVAVSNLDDSASGDTQAQLDADLALRALVNALSDRDWTMSADRASLLGMRLREQANIAGSGGAKHNRSEPPVPVEMVDRVLTQASLEMSRESGFQSLYAARPFTKALTNLAHNLSGPGHEHELRICLANMIDLDVQR